MDRKIKNARAEAEVGSAAWKKLITDGAARLNIPLAPDQVDRMAMHAGELAFWNRKMNLTAIKAPLDVAVKHYLDSIVSAPYIEQGASLLDIGSGAGFPGIPLKIIMPSLSVTLVDASRKKVSFLNHVIQTLQLQDISALHIRLEQMKKIPHQRHAFDVITCRAFSELENFVLHSLPLLKSEGVLIALKGKEAESELAPMTIQQNGVPMLRVRAEEGGDVYLAIKTVRCVLPHLNLSRVLILLTRE